VLESASVAWLESLTERGLDQPLLALLRAQRFHDVHLVHGATEFGRDFIAKREDGGTLRQYALQSKVGDLGVGAWREARLQIDSIRTGGLSHPSFEAELPRVGVLVTTGRLVGDARLEAQAYALQYAEEMTFEVWDIDRLVEMIVSRPEAALAGRDVGALLRMLGAAEARELDDRTVEQFTRRWIPADGAFLDGADVLEAAVLCGRLAGTDRLDLACFTALGLLRAAAIGAWAADRTDGDAAVGLGAANALFVDYGEQLWARCDEQLLKPVPFVNRHNEFGFFATYPVRCARTVELLALLALWQDAADGHDPGPLREWLRRFVADQPGAAHPLSDRYAVSLLAPAVLLVEDRALVERWLRAAVVWVADRYEQPLLGLGSVDADPEQEVGYLLSALEHIDLQRRRDSYLATVLLDLLSALELRQLYAEARHELEAVHAFPLLLHAPDSPAALRRDGKGIEQEIGPPYADGLPEGDWIAATHQRDAQPMWLERAGCGWVALACSSVLRDRHDIGLVRRMLLARASAMPSSPTAQR
jgi:hypothetical protein